MCVLVGQLSAISQEEKTGCFACCAGPTSLRLALESAERRFLFCVGARKNPWPAKSLALKNEAEQHFTAASRFYFHIFGNLAIHGSVCGEQPPSLPQHHHPTITPPALALNI